MRNTLKRVKLNSGIEFFKIGGFKLNDFYKQTFASAPFGIINIKQNGLLTSMNIEAQKMFEYDIDHTVETYLSDLFPKQSKETYNGTILSRFLRIWLEKNLYQWVEVILKRKDGSELYVVIFAQKIESENGEFTTIFVNDISEKKKIASELYKLRSAVYSAQEVVFITDLNGVFTYVNPSFSKVYGYLPEEVIGLKTPRIFKSPFIKDDANNFWNQLISKERIPPVQYKNQRKDGTLVDIEGIAEPILDDRGKSIGYLGVHRDISEQVKTLGILNEALYKSEESNRLKAEFLANMSHEFRTPLNAIIGLSSLIDADTPLEDILEYVKIINLNGERLLDIVEDLFDLSIINSGKIEIAKKEINLHVFLLRVDILIREHQYKINKKHIRLNLNLHNGDEKIVFYADELKLKKALMHLLKNALEYTEQGYVYYGYDIEKKDSQTLIKFFIKDSGIGIQDVYKEIIYESFRQADGSLTRKHNGLGIGLTVAKRLINEFGGNIWYESKPGQTTTFFFTFPLESKVLNMN